MIILYSTSAVNESSVSEKRSDKKHTIQEAVGKVCAGHLTDGRHAPCIFPVPPSSPKGEFPPAPQNKGSANIWFTSERHLEVTILIDAQVSHYFKRRTMFPTQKIREERPDGSLVVSFRVGQYEAIRNILKSWIPHIVILEPEEFKKDFLADVRRWVKRQESSCQ